MTDLERAIQKFGDLWVNNMQNVVPVRSGRLRDSLLFYIQDMGGSALEMVYYGQFVNDGTKYMKGDHFIDESWKATRFDTAVENEIEKEVDKIFDKMLK